MKPNEVSKNNDEPDDIVSMQNSAFCVIMELTKEEKRELIALWRSNNGQKP